MIFHRQKSGMRSCRLRLLAGAALGASVAVTGAYAQGGLVVDEIVVTAQKREESLLDVPIAITAVTGEFLTETGISDLDELSDFIPGFQLQTQSVNTPSYVIRGITSDVSEPNTEPNISVFFDGVPGSRGAGSIIELFDLERVEVAKGPQGTLFSRGASNGAINFIFNKPEEEFGASGKVAFGNYDSQRYEGVVNVPIVEDVLLTRFGAVYAQRDGYSENPVDGGKLNGQDTVHLRGSATLRPTDTLEYTVLGYYQKDEPDPTGFKTLVPLLAGADPNTVNTDPFGEIAQSPDVFLERDLWGVTGLGEWQFADAWSLSSTTGYREYGSEDKFDPDGIGPFFIVDPSAPPAFPPTLLAIPFILDGFEDDEGDLFNHEFRVNYDAGGRLKAFAGVSYYYEEAVRNRRFSYSQDALGLVFGGPAVPIVLGTVTEETFTSNENESYSVFGDVSFDLTDTLNLTAGLRWTIDQMEFSYNAPAASPASAIIPSVFGGVVFNPFSPGGITAGGPIPPGVETNALEGTTGGQTLTTEDDFDYLEPRIVATWRYLPDWIAYASWSSGVRSGGLDIDPRQGLSESAYRRVIKPERVTSYEIGTKGSFTLDAADFAFDGALFYYDYQDFQSLVVTAGSLVPVNTGEASAVGAEAALNADFNNGFNAFGNIGFIDGGFDEGVNADLLGNAIDLEGNQFRLTPKWTAAFGASYRRPIAQELEAYGSFLWSYKSDFFFNPENEPDLAQDAYSLVTVNLGLALNERYDLRLRVENLFNKDYLLDAGNTGRILGIPTSVRGQPRLWTVGLSASF